MLSVWYPNPAELRRRAAMFHRHLNHHWYTLAAIDDVICGEPLETCVVERRGIEKGDAPA